MNSCEAVRELIEKSLGCALAPEAERELVRHLAECPSCRAYREALLSDDSLLDEYVSRHADSVRSVEKKAAGARPAGIGAAPRRFPLPRRLAEIPRWLQIAAAIAVALAILAVTDYLRGYHDGSVPAYASVIAKIEKAENVFYRERTWSNGRWRTRHRAMNSTGMSRNDYGDSIIVSSRNSIAGMKLYPLEKRAVLFPGFTDRPWRAPREEESSVERLATWHKKRNFTYLRRKWYEGKRAAMYQGMTMARGKPTNVKFVTLVDLGTQLPMRVEITNKLPRNTTDSGPYGMRLRDFIPPASPRPKDFGWVDIREDEPRIIEDDFRWNAPVDTAFFSLTPPEGYTVQIVRDTFELDDHAETARESLHFDATELRDGLAEWLSMSGNAFPDELHDLGNADTLRTRLIAKYNKSGVPGDEYRAAIMASERLKRAMMMIEYLEKCGSITYAGSGCAFGDASRVVCSLRNLDVGSFFPELKGKEPYAFIYGDLHIEMKDAPPVVK